MSVEGLLVVCLVVYAFYFHSVVDRPGMHRTSNIKPGAEIVSVNPKYVGAWGGGKQTRIIIEFSDGSYYRCRFGKAGPAFARDKIEYTEGELLRAKRTAIVMHDEVVQKKTSRVR